MEGDKVGDVARLADKLQRLHAERGLLALFRLGKRRADGYLTKLFSARELLARVSGAIAMARVRREAAEKVAESEARAARFLAGMTEGDVVLDYGSRVVEINYEGLRHRRAASARGKLASAELRPTGCVDDRRVGPGIDGVYLHNV